MNFRDVLGFTMSSISLIWLIAFGRAQKFQLSVREKVLEDESKLIDWFIHLRWIAFFVALMVLGIGVYVIELVREDRAIYPLTLLVMLIGISNYVFSRLRDKIPHRKLLLFQILSDLIILTALLHFSGSIENPFFVIYVFHVFIASVIFDKKEAYLTVFFSVFLFLGVVALEFAKILPHYTLHISPYHGNLIFHPMYTFSVSSVFMILIFVSNFFAISLSSNLKNQIREQKELYSNLVQSAKLAAIGEFAGNIAHEINNPLNVIIMKVKNILSDFGKIPEQKLKRDVEMIDKYAEKIRVTMEGILRFAKPYDFWEKFNVNDAISDVLGMVGAKTERKGISLVLELGDIPDVYGNPNQIQQVILNLINNSIDAISDEKIEKKEIRIRTSASGKFVKIEVSDTGVGISNSVKDKIFEPFFTTKENGTGLGLYISKKIVEKHGGYISFESDERGTSFFVFLPYG